MSLTKKHFKSVAEIINNHVFNYSVEDDVFLNDNKREYNNNFKPTNNKEMQ